MTSRAQFRRVALLGLGLIGSSLAHVIRARGLAGHIAGHARTARTRRRAQDLNLADSIHRRAAEAAAGADLVILCTPVGAMGELARQIAPALAPGALLSDVGSVKSRILEEVGPYVPPGVAFVPAHPVAGTEQSGPDSGFAGLFERHWCILTPPPGSPRRARTRLRRFWQACGAQVIEMTPDHHDRVLAVTSHLPHLIAYTIVGTAAEVEEVSQAEVIKYSAGGFRDFTRLASSDPVMWRDIFLANRGAVLEILDRFSGDLAELRKAIAQGRAGVLQEVFARQRQIRRRIIAAGQEMEAPDFGRRLRKPRAPGGPRRSRSAQSGGA